MFLNHQRYEEMKNLVGEEATMLLAQRYGGQYIYFPKLEKDGFTKGPRLDNGLQCREVRSLICRLRRDGQSGTSIVAAIEAAWPEDRSKWVSKSALSRFMIRVRKGYMREFGIDDMFREING